MINRPSRDRLALALRRYAVGQITNDELDAVSVDWRDRGAVAVQQMAWNLYDDNRQHHAGPELARNSEGRRTIARWIVFLSSDAEYMWPEYSFLQILNWPMNIITLGWWERTKRRKWEQFLEAGDFSVWPFCRREELEAAVQKPRLLVGHGRDEDQ